MKYQKVLRNAHHCFPEAQVEVVKLVVLSDELSKSLKYWICYLLLDKQIFTL